MPAWWVLYGDGVPLILVSAPTSEVAEQMYRQQMMGQPLPEKIWVVGAMNAELDDLLRLGIVALMSGVTQLVLQVMNAQAAAQARAAARGVPGGRKPV